MLGLEGIEDELAHLDVALGAVGLGVLLFASHHGFAHQDEPPLEVDVLPLEPVYFASAHPSEESHREVGAEIGAHRVEDALHLVQAERIHSAIRRRRWNYPLPRIR